MGACCFEDGHCEDLFEEVCGALHGRWVDGPCEDAGCEDEEEPRACCDGFDCYDALPSVCSAQGGVPAEDDVLCHQWSCGDDAVCREPAPDRLPAGGSMWSRDRWNHVPVGPAKVDGKWQFVTMKPCRATRSGLTYNEDPCRYHIAHLNRRLDGKYQIVMCAEPELGGQFTKRWNVGQVYQQHVPDPAGLVRQFAWSVRMPFENWQQSEVVFFKEGIICGDEVQ